MKLKYWGLIADPDTLKVKQTLNNSNIYIGNAFCGNITWLKQRDNCNDHLNEKLFLSDWNQQCQNKKECKFNLGKE